VYITFDFFRNIEIKQLDTYIDQVTTDKLSLVSRLRTSDDIVQNCSDKDILRMSANLKRMFSHSINDDGKSIDLTIAIFSVQTTRFARCLQNPY
jgi:hypothetical protein